MMSCALKLIHKHISSSKAFVRCSEPGYYRLKGFVPEVRVVVANELNPMKEENTLLLLQSTDETFRGYLAELLKHETLSEALQKYLSLKLVIEGKELNDMEEVKKIKKKFSFEENIRYSIEQLGIEKVIDSVGIKKVINSADKKSVVRELLEELGRKKVLELIDEQKDL